jgi:hypothetical protein
MMAQEAVKMKAKMSGQQMVQLQAPLSAKGLRENLATESVALTG